MSYLTISESAVAQHEILMSYVKAGFTRSEALELLKTLIAAGTNQPK
jgi:hypothetical protein